MEIVRESFLKYPHVFFYLYYDLLYHRNEIDYFIKKGDGVVSGFVLVYKRPAHCPAVHVVGVVDGLPIPRFPCMRVHFEASGVADDFLEGLVGSAKRAELSLLMYCGGWCREIAARYAQSRAVRRLAEEDYEDYVKLVGLNLSREEYMESARYGAYIGDELVSVASAYRLPEIWIIHSVYTKPEYRRRGFGIAVTAKATYDALEVEGRAAALSVFENNTPAVKMYRKLGYKAIRTFLYLEI